MRWFALVLVACGAESDDAEAPTCEPIECTEEEMGEGPWLNDGRTDCEICGEGDDFAYHCVIGDIDGNPVDVQSDPDPEVRDQQWATLCSRGIWDD